MATEDILNKARAAIAPLTPANDCTVMPKDFLISAKRTAAGRRLPPHYSVYFLLVDLLNFKDRGRSEKTAWSIPVDLDGRAFLIEHRKLGVGVFAEDLPRDEVAAAEIVRLIHAGLSVARPCLAELASDAVAGSQLNVVNRSSDLFERYRYHAQLYKTKFADAERRKDERTVTVDGHMTTTVFPAFALHREANWLAIAAIESFFSWTEHIFIHLAILAGKCVTGASVAELARCDWSRKYKNALDLGDSRSKRFYDELLTIRRQIRNFIAHGSFGKRGEAFSFHSSIGAVPVRFADGPDEFRFGGGVAFSESEAICIIEAFIDHLWSGPRRSARIYLESDLPLILSLVAKGDYERAMASESEMIVFTEHLVKMWDDAANMD